MTTCANCSKSIRTANGMAFHASWCKPAAPVAEPVRTVTMQADAVTQVRAPITTVLHLTDARSDGPVPALLGRSDWFTDADAIAYAREQSTAHPAPQRFAVYAPDNSYLGSWESGRELGAFVAHDFGNPCSCADCAEPDVAPAPEHQDIGGSWTCADCNGRTYELPIVSHAVYHGTRAERARDLIAPAPKARKAAAPKSAKLPAIRSGKHARCVAHLPMTRTAPGVAYACFDVAPDQDAIAERQAFVAELDASWTVRHDAYKARLTPEPSPAAWKLAAVSHARVAAAYATHMATGAELATTRERIRKDIAGSKQAWMKYRLAGSDVLYDMAGVDTVYPAQQAA